MPCIPARAALTSCKSDCEPVRLRTDAPLGAVEAIELLTGDVYTGRVVGGAFGIATDEEVFTGATPGEGSEAEFGRGDLGVYVVTPFVVETRGSADVADPGVDEEERGTYVVTPFEFFAPSGEDPPGARALGDDVDRGVYVVTEPDEVEPLGVVVVPDEPPECGVYVVPDEVDGRPPLLFVPPGVYVERGGGEPLPDPPALGGGDGLEAGGRYVELPPLPLACGGGVRTAAGGGGGGADLGGGAGADFGGGGVVCATLKTGKANAPANAKRVARELNDRPQSSIQHPPVPACTTIPLSPRGAYSIAYSLRNQCHIPNYRSTLVLHVITPRPEGSPQSWKPEYEN
jgi:hypothetical protein